MKIYTKKGDTGKTRLFNNECVSKDSLRVEAYGAVDELNAVIGLVRSHGVGKKMDKILLDLQKNLFVLGADLASPLDYNYGRKINRIKKTDTKKIEKIIDEIDAKLPKLNSFIIPVGLVTSATLQVARTVCRRAERFAVKLDSQEKINKEIIIYLNRLSDLLFVLARTINFENNIQEVKVK